MTSVGWGIIGCGRIATRAVAPAINWSANGHLVAVASRDRNVAEAKARELGALRGYAPYDAMLSDPAIDAVYIGLPNGLHEEWAVRCAQAGKHVLCEKSLTLSLASARRMAAAFSQRGLRLVDAFMYRHHPRWSLVRRLIDEGAIGTPLMVRVGFCHRLDDLHDHRWSAQLGGGALWDLTCYGVNVARFVTGTEPVRVAAFADARTPEGVDAATQASLMFANGVLASVTGSMRGGTDNSVVIDGEEGTIELQRAFLPHWDSTFLVLRRPGGGGRGASVRRSRSEPLLAPGRAFRCVGPGSRAFDVAGRGWCAQRRGLRSDRKELAHRNERRTRRELTSDGSCCLAKSKSACARPRAVALAAGPRQGDETTPLGGVAALPARRVRLVACTMCTTWSRTTATRITEPMMTKVQFEFRRHIRRMPLSSW
jgi:xylose dehydrogenase (NAD/NADP)